MMKTKGKDSGLVLPFLMGKDCEAACNLLLVIPAFKKGMPKICRIIRPNSSDCDEK